MAQFSIEDLTFAYPESDQLSLIKINAQIEAGEYVCVCGRSGCGKTTLLRHLKTVLTPVGNVSGKILFNGKSLWDIDQRTQSAQIGFVMQNPEAQIVTDKVWHELAFGLESLGIDQRTMRMRVAEMASYFGIARWFHRDVQELSGGQKQLLNLASIMAMHPSVLILDEPTSQLDPIAASDFLNTVRKINIELGTTIIITEHRLEDVFSTADKVLCLERGHLVAQGSPREVAAELHEHKDAMTYALPAPVRIFYGVTEGGLLSIGDIEGNNEIADDRKGNLPQKTIGKDPTKCPLTVREGRTWLPEYVGENPPSQASLPDVPPPDLDDADLALEMKEVWFRYDRDAPDILRGLDMKVPKATLFAIVGGNGTGKSTTLKCLSGVVKPYRGKTVILGRKLKDWKGEDLFKGGLAMLPQDPQNLFVKNTVREDLEEMFENRSISKEERDAKVLKVAEECDILRLLDRNPFDLSGGEQQRTGLAKVLLTDPQLLLLDEPTKGMDNFFKRSLANVFEKLKARGVTIVMVSHDIEFCARFADSVSMFFDGGIVTTNSPRGFFAQNSFYTTAANRMGRSVFVNAVTDEDVVSLCLS